MPTGRGSPVPSGSPTSTSRRPPTAGPRCGWGWCATGSGEPDLAALPAAARRAARPPRPGGTDLRPRRRGRTAAGGLGAAAGGVLADLHDRRVGHLRSGDSGPEGGSAGGGAPPRWWYRCCATTAPIRTNLGLVNASGAPLTLEVDAARRRRGPARRPVERPRLARLHPARRGARRGGAGRRRLRGGLLPRPGGPLRRLRLGGRQRHRGPDSGPRPGRRPRDAAGGAGGGARRRASAVPSGAATWGSSTRRGAGGLPPRAARR